eukprot:2488934-Prymnesium_polylepis.2
MHTPNRRIADTPTSLRRRGAVRHCTAQRVRWHTPPGWRPPDAPLHPSRAPSRFATRQQSLVRCPSSRGCPAPAT